MYNFNLPCRWRLPGFSLCFCEGIIQLPCIKSVFFLSCVCGTVCVSETIVLPFAGEHMLVQQRLRLAPHYVIQLSPSFLCQERQCRAFVIFALKLNNCTVFNLSSCRSLWDHTDTHSYLKASKTSDVQIRKIMVLLNRTGAVALCGILKMSPLFSGALMKAKLP